MCAQSSPFVRTAGLLLHPTSLPGRGGVGDLGSGARAFVDWLARARLGLWQVLPLVPPGVGGCPYSSAAAMAGSPLLVDLVDLRRAGLLDAGDLDGPAFDPDRADFVGAWAFKEPRLRKATGRLLAGAAPELLVELDAFRERAAWAHDTAVYEALRRARGGEPWWRWERPVRDRQPKGLRAAVDAVASDVEHGVAAQFLFDRQWRALRAYAADRGVRVLGDAPIYVDRDSVDVWAHREQFLLAADGSPRLVAGVPPDYFSETGQLWGNPLYDWARMARDGYAWWVGRLARTFELVDLLRIDHFRAFASYWAVPADADDARSGAWNDGPRMAFFDAVRAALGELPIVAEDLGMIDEGVRALRREAGLPGMCVLQFAFGDGPDNLFLPHNHDPASVVYTGTHDNDTTLGWWRAAPEHIRDHVRRYLAVDGHDVVWDLVRAALASVAVMAVVPMQDVLSLDSGARMNTPGQPFDNWAWRARAEAFADWSADRLRGLIELYGRCE